MFVPTTKEELTQLGWDGKLDVIIITGDTYIDVPNDGAAVIAKVLIKSGWKVGIIAQPDVTSLSDITRLGEPRLFWGVTAGCVDSMVANYTALMKKKRNDDLTPGEENNKRPDRATIVYTNLIRKYFKNTVPIILGGIEASLRRIAHYDYWTDSVRRAVIFDAKADAILYGMGEKSIIEIARKMELNENWKNTRGISYISKEIPDNEFIELPSFEEVKSDKAKFIKMFDTFYKNNDPYSARMLIQKYDNRYLIQNPPQFLPTTEELDSYYIDFERDAHPYYLKQGKIKALETIKFSVTSHRGCYGECNFCSITVHQGRRIVSRSEDSIIKEVVEITKLKDFKGYITDIGGPTANMYQNFCKAREDQALCENKRCAYPKVCGALELSHKSQINLLNKIRKINGVKKVFIGSGIRYDLIIEDKKDGSRYLRNIVENHISGQMKIAPEHIEENVLDAMGKSSKYLVDFKQEFDKLSKEMHKKQFLTYYFIAAHPGCDEKNMKSLKQFLKKELKLNPEQVQIFTPTPSTYSTLMYYTEKDPFSNNKIFVEKSLKNKRIQKEIITKNYLGK
jgi:uncharacterized radical SAM protein YgiQ